MDLAPTINTYVTIESGEKQLLYYSEKPKFSFPINEEIVDGKKVLRQSTAVWTPIILEAPTRLLPDTQKWIDEQTTKKISLSIITGEGRLCEQWAIHGAVAKSNHIARSRVSDSDIVRILVAYSWAQKMR